MVLASAMGATGDAGAAKRQRMAGQAHSIYGAAVRLYDYNLAFAYKADAVALASHLPGKIIWGRDIG